VFIPDSVTQFANDAFVNCDSQVIECMYGSYAEQYCWDNGIFWYNYGE